MPPAAKIEGDGGERLQFATDDVVPTEAVVQPAAILLERAVTPPLPTVWRSAPAPGHRRIPTFRSIAIRVGADLATEWDRGTAFLFLPVLLAAGALTYFSLPFEPAWQTLALCAAALTGLAFMARRHLATHLALAALLAFALGMVFAKIENWRAGTKVLGAEITTRLTGRVALIEHLANGRTRLTLHVIATERPRLRYAPDRVRVTARTAPSGLVAGAVVGGVVRLMPPSGPLRPGGYDFSFESYFDGLGANGFFLRDPEIVESVESVASSSVGTRAAAWVENARAAFAARIEGHIGSAEGEIAAALVAGVRAGIPEDVNEALRQTGLAHILSISGLHMALVAGTIMLILRAGFAFFPEFASRKPVKKYAASVALVALAVYLFISGSAVAAERSFVMIAVMLSALLVDRSALTIRNLAIAAILILALSPHEAAGPSFQMSFAATAALIGAYAAWSEHRRRRPPAPPVERGLLGRAARTGLLYFGGLAATSLIAGGATALYGAHHFQRVATLGLVANLAAMPVVSLGVMLPAVLGVVFMPFGLDGPIFWVMGQGLSWLIGIARWIAERSPLDSVGMIPPAAVACLTVALTLATLLTTWLRVAAIPFVAVGVALLATRPMPDLLISEDARLVALGSSTGLQINRSRPNGFTIDSWVVAMNAGEPVKPVKRAEKAVRRDFAAIGFACGSGLCVARHKSGALIVHADTAELAWPYCVEAALIVIDDATVARACPFTQASIITKRDLARRGSASVSFGGDGIATVTFAITEPYRPWHAQRQFSREARGLPPYRRPERQAQAAPPALSVHGGR
jgi:ComEC/Rec2-related protein